MSNIASTEVRQVQKQGWIYKRGPLIWSKWKPKWMVLYNLPYQTLHIYDHRAHAAPPYHPKHTINPLKCRTDIARGTDHGRIALFTIETKEKKYYLSAESVDERDDWLRILRQFENNDSLKQEQVPVQNAPTTNQQNIRIDLALFDECILSEFETNSLLSLYNDYCDSKDSQFQFLFETMPVNNEYYQNALAHCTRGDFFSKLKCDIHLCRLIGAFKIHAESVIKDLVDSKSTWNRSDEQQQLIIESLDSQHELTNQELKAINAINRTRSSLATSLVAIVEYKCHFFKVTATIQSQIQLALSLQADSWLFDASKLSILSTVGQALNLKEHNVLFNQETVGLNCPLNVQIYQSNENRLYLDHLHRLFPLDVQDPKRKDMNQRLRPEFIQGHSQPLSCNAFYDDIPGTYLNKTLDETELIQAAASLRDQTIVQFVKKLDNLDILPIDSGGFTRELHRNGINVRYLGNIAWTTKLPHVRLLCHIEMVARASKSLLRQKLHRLSEDDGQCQLTALQMVQNILTLHESSLLFYNENLFSIIQEKFSYTLSDSEFMKLHRPALLHAIQFHCPIQFKDRCDYDFSSKTPLVNDDFLGFHVLSKTVDGAPIQEALDRRFEPDSSSHVMDAESAYIYALGRQMALTGGRHGYRSSLASCFNHLAGFYNRTGRHGEALHYAKIALGLSLHYHASTAAILMTISEALFMSDYWPQTEVGRSAFDTESNDLSHSTVLDIHAPAAMTDPTTGGVDKMAFMSYYEAALAIVKYHWSDSHPFILSLHDKLVQWYCKVKEMSKALHYHHFSIDLAARTMGRNHKIFSSYVTQAGYMYRALGENDRALQIFLDALQSAQNVPDNIRAVAENHFCLADVHYVLGDVDQALHHSHEAKRLREKQLGPLDSDTLASYYQLAQLAMTRCGGDFSVGSSLSATNSDEGLDVSYNSVSHLLSNSIIMTAESMRYAQLALQCLDKAFRYCKNRLSSQSDRDELMRLSRSIMIIKLRLMTSTQRDIWRALMLQQGNQELTPELMREVVVRLMALTPHSYMDHVLARIQEGDGQAALEWNVIAHLAQNQPIS